MRKCTKSTRRKYIHYWDNAHTAQKAECASCKPELPRSPNPSTDSRSLPVDIALPAKHPCHSPAPIQAVPPPPPPLPPWKTQTRIKPLQISAPREEKERERDRYHTSTENTEFSDYTSVVVLQRPIPPTRQQLQTATLDARNRGAKESPPKQTAIRPMHIRNKEHQKKEKETEVYHNAFQQDIVDRPSLCLCRGGSQQVLLQMTWRKTGLRDRTLGSPIPQRLRKSPYSQVRAREMRCQFGGKATAVRRMGENRVASLHPVQGPVHAHQHH